MIRNSQLSFVLYECYVCSYSTTREKLNDALFCQITVVGYSALEN